MDRSALWTAALSVVLAALLAASAPAAAAPAAAAEADALRAQARAQHLADDPEWLALLHYHERPWPLAPQSLIDDPAFFLAPSGASDPSAELDATLEAFAAPPTATDNDPRCLWPARWRWLSSRLPLAPGGDKKPVCPALDVWLAAIDPGSATLVFPAAYLDNPSSMFGHTFLRIDPPGRQGTLPLASYAVNYGAVTGEDVGVLFAVRGLVGSYKGYYSIQPYYVLVRSYSDLESRDIWEYELTLEPAEVDLMVRNVWELRGRGSDYYFLKENCSFMLLSLLDVARPSLHLDEGFDLYAMPNDTVRRVLENKKILRAAVFRASSRTRIDALRQSLPPAEQSLALDLARGVRTADDPVLRRLQPEPRARVIELAQDYLEYQLDSGHWPRDVVAPRALALIQARGRIKDVGGPPDPPAPPVRPDQGHLPARALPAFGMTGSRPFASLELRPALHGFLDPAAGYLAGASIEVLDGELRYYPSHGLSLERFDAVSIESLTPVDSLFLPISWRLDVGAERWRERGDSGGELVGGAGGGAGFAIAPTQGLLMAAMLGGQLLADRDWPHGRLLGVGPSLDLVWSPTDAWTVTLGSGLQAILGDGIDGRYALTLGQSLAIDKNLALRLDAAVKSDGGDAYTEWRAGLAWYF